MKKTIFAAIAALATIFSANVMAEETEYNMVITLQNGTTITLGHNDIKNITFNGEEISISGNAADTIKDNSDNISALWEYVGELKNYIGSNHDEILANTEMIYMLRDKVNYLEYRLNEEVPAEINDYINSLMVKYTELADFINYLEAKIAELEAKVAQIEAN